MTRVRASLFSSLDGRSPGLADGDDQPMGEDWGRVTAAYAATRTFRQRVLGDTTGAGTTGLDDVYAARAAEGIGAEVMGAAMFGLHAHPDDPAWRGWWGEEPPFGYPVYVLTSSAPRPSIAMPNGTVFHFRSARPADVLAEARESAGGADVLVGGGVRTTCSFLRAGLVDDLHVMTAPVVLGRGAPLWEGLRGLETTHRVRSEVSESGTVHVTFTRGDA